MSNLRMTSDLRRQLILGAAKRCFARNGFAGTTTKSVAAAAAISEGLLFKHFPSKAALYAEILAEECEADPELAHLLGQEPSTATLVELVRGMVGHFVSISNGSDQEEEQRLRFMAASHLEDGEFARLMYVKIADLIGATFVTSLERAIAAGDAVKIGGEPLNLFWFAHHTVLTAAMTRLPRYRRSILSKRAPRATAIIAFVSLQGTFDGPRRRILERQKTRNRHCKGVRMAASRFPGRSPASAIPKSRAIRQLPLAQLHRLHDFIAHNLTEKLTLALSTAKDATAPHTATASGRLVVTTVAPRIACTGQVTLTLKAGTKTLLTKAPVLKLKDGACEYAGKLTISAKARKTARTAKITASFAGNAALLAASSKAVTARLA